MKQFCIYISLLFLLVSPLVEASAQSARTIYGVLLDCSDGMNRQMSESTTVGQEIKLALGKHFFQEERFSPLTVPGLTEGTWYAFRHLGGAKNKDERSCEISGEYYSFNHDGVCMLSDWKRGTDEGAPAMEQLYQVWGNGGPDSDHSILGGGLVGFLTDNLSVGPGEPDKAMKLLFISDGGESCNRNDGNTAVDLLESYLSSSGNGSRIFVTILGVAITDNYAKQRLSNLRRAFQEAGASHAVLVITPESLGEARIVLQNEIAKFVSEINRQHYNACKSCYPTRQNTCDCCYYANYWRNQCPYPTCYPQDCPPEYECMHWTTVTVEYPDGSSSSVDVCDHWEEYFCPDPRHSCTQYCGSEHHPCGPDVMDNGECALLPCQFCSATTGQFFPWYPSPIWHDEINQTESFGNRNYIGGSSGCSNVTTCPDPPPIPLDEEMVNADEEVEHRGAKPLFQYAPTRTYNVDDVTGDYN